MRAAWRACRPSTVTSRAWRWPRATTGSTWCAASCAEAPRHLTKNGALLCEIGRGRKPLEAAFPRLPFLWLDTEQSEGEVFWIARGAI